MFGTLTSGDQVSAAAQVEWSNLEGTPGSAKDGAGVLFVGPGTQGTGPRGPGERSGAI